MAFSSNNMLLILMFISSRVWTLSESGPVHNRWSLSRIKRQQTCQDGTYEHDDRQCCSCAAGQRLKQHCTVSTDTVCELCDRGTYNLHPNHKPTCEPCTSCSHTNANLEEVEACTSYKDAVCQCKPGHYCDSVRGTCAFCHPCDDCGGAENIQVNCSSPHNTVCRPSRPNDEKEEPQGGMNVAAVIVIIIMIILILAVIVAVALFYRRKKTNKGGTARLQEDEGTEMIERQADPEELQPLKGVDLSHHLPDIVEVVGWKAMRDLALRSGISLTAIESHEENHPNDAVERTFQLLKQWVEKQGTGAPETLVQLLKEGSQNGKAKKVKEIIAKKPQAGNNTPGSA